MSARSISIKTLGLLSCWLFGAELFADAAEQDSVEALPSFMVTAWHFPEEVLDIPADVVRIERAQIERSAAANVPELLQSEANVLFRSTSGRVSGGEISMRGFGEGSGLRSLVLVDGQPMNPADMGSIDWEQVPLDSVESVEVLHGGQNVLYGDRALSGVIKIETRQAEGTHLELKADVGSYGYHRESVNASAMSGAWGVRIGGSWMSEEGDRDNSETWSRNVNAAVEYFFESGDRIGLALSGGTLYNQLPGPLATVPPEDETTEESGRATIHMQGDRDWGTYNCSIGYDYSDADWDFFGYSENQQTGWTVRPRVQLGEAEERIIFGTDVIYDTLDFRKYQDEAHAFESSNAAIEEGRISPYIFAEKGMDDQLTLSGGARYEWTRFDVDNQAYVLEQINPYYKTNRGNLLPNPNYKNPADFIPEKTYSETVRAQGGAAEISLNYRFAERWSAWIGYDHSYRYPVVDERADYQGGDLAENVNRDLEAEEGDGLDFGLKYIGEQHQLSLTAYALWMDNEIAYDEVLKLNLNLGPVNRYGADFSWSYTNERYGCSTRIAYVQTEMRAGPGRGNSVPLVPSLHATTQVWYELVKDLRVTLSHRYVGKQYQGSDPTHALGQIDDYNVVDARIHYQVNEHCSVYLKGTNVLDQNYVGSAYRDSYYPGQGAAVYTGMTLKF